MEKPGGKADTGLNIWKPALGPRGPVPMGGEAGLLVGGDRGVCCSPPSAPKPRGFSQALQEPPTQICSQTFPAVWDAEIDSSIHSVTKYFLKIQSLPDTVLCWVCSRERDAVSGPLQGHQLLQWSVQDRSSSGAENGLGLPEEKGTSARA